MRYQPVQCTDQRRSGCSLTMKENSRLSRSIDPDHFWGWHPTLPLKINPVFAWPPQPLKAIQYLCSAVFLGAVLLPFSLTAFFAWTWLQPELEYCRTFHWQWIGQIWLRNMGLMLSVAGGLHIFFYVLKRQGNQYRYDHREIRTNRRFFANRQVLDNMLWTLASGVTFWTLYEALLFWAMANGYAPVFLDWRDHPLIFVLGFVLIPFFTSMHFYFIHRLLHWTPLYRLAHSLHHRNDNPGPWSGLSMHPVEHAIYLSSVLIHFLMLSHPLHILFHMHWNTLGAATSHVGFEAIIVRGRRLLTLGSFHHQIHHRLVDCNYGNPYMPWDRWLGTDHDGSAEATVSMRTRKNAGN